MSARAAVTHIDWSKLSSLGLKKDTQAALTSFRKRYDELKRNVDALKEQKTDIDFAHYRSVLKNKKVVEQAEKAFTSFSPVKYNLASQLKVIDAFEIKAVEKAKSTAAQLDAEVADLKQTLTNIETARPIEDLTVDDVIQAKPDIPAVVEDMIKKGNWTVPGYNEKFGNLSVL
ncbi:putative ATP7-F1F0-ATPase complex, FO D subunit [Basidiobolus meristosporus CBS 931.73]|uniref:ATP synthase subunit d, mitochondrial n=1 Tax=Basidiobolus meristosporus CBS 931.73 TaxID=1314790 RepID=A0A1Y1X1I7_9FUNG|nr:putative ATP7-F1F0-ATPase complex, FO D subunit [Basidiobolus meristosporus CBS 931.73]|eukprot:ORX79276.1 putative ATP7-F1F0-ATPase complex, FO D subunit [Basidiobolus meristosporus CBS 931.73]